MIRRAITNNCFPGNHGRNVLSFMMELPKVDVRFLLYALFGKMMQEVRGGDNQCLASIVPHLVDGVSPLGVQRAEPLQTFIGML